MVKVEVMETPLPCKFDRTANTRVIYGYSMIGIN